MKSPAEKIIKAFGGMTKLARAHGCAVSTVQGWKERGRIPQDHWLPIIDAAKRDGLDLSLDDFLATPSPTPERESAA
ncbi:hypothetical protein T8J41_13770 [Nitratireductor rhodophyticola]|uniref:carph-isopro domain-containing protein n=1 Tax=Nitratireductor rhodophyticola TaxID=2854036 RepID=UPI002AC99C6B|nr:hypothetical protein [Nitratireductor rhodophyticola]WPZ13224.1 hypothetical protein T8J41_13770 [Nitratireductor rhodophyticola]